MGAWDFSLLQNLRIYIFCFPKVSKGSEVCLRKILLWRFLSNKCLLGVLLQGEGTQFGCSFLTICLNVNSDSFCASWPPSAATPPFPAILLGFPSTAEMSEHGSGDKSPLKPTNKFLEFAVHCEPMNYPFGSEMGS